MTKDSDSRSLSSSMNEEDDIAKKVLGFFPIIKQMQTYKARDILTDFLSGVTVSVVLLPQAIAFSGLAGVEPIQELISSFYVLLFYLVFGGSIGLAVGPEASVAIITGVTIMEQIEETTLTAAQIGTLLALIVGVLCVLMSVLKMGFVDQILSGFLLIGFVTGVANLIIIEQMPNLFGLPGSVLAGEDSTIGKLTKVIKAGNLISGATVAVSISNIAFLFTVKYLKKTYFHGNAIVSRIPEILVLVVTMIACSALLDFKGRGIPTIGTFKNTIPKPTFPPLELALVMKLITPSVIITLVGFIECQTVTKMYGMKHGGAPTGDRELFALGFANILGSIFGCLPMFASLPRSRVLAGTKPVSMLGNAFAGVLVLMMSQLLVPALQFLPKATLGSIVTVATLGLIEIKEMRFAVQMRSWTEIGMMTLTYAVTLITTIANGVLVCLGLSALMIVRKTTTSVMSVMGRVPVSSSSRDSSDNDFRSGGITMNKATTSAARFVSVTEHPDAELLDGVVLLRVDVPIMFYNCGQIRGTIESMMRVESQLLNIRPSTPAQGPSSFGGGMRGMMTRISMLGNRRISSVQTGYQTGSYTKMDEEKGGLRGTNRHSMRVAPSSTADFAGIQGTRKATRRIVRDGFHTIIFDLKSAFEMDSAATFVLKKIFHIFETKGVEVYLCGVHEWQLKMFRMAGMDEIVEGRVFETMAAAVMAVEHELDVIDWRSV